MLSIYFHHIILPKKHSIKNIEIAQNTTVRTQKGKAETQTEIIHY